MCRASETPLDRAESAVADLLISIAEQPPGQLGSVIIRSRQLIDRLEAGSAEATRRFEKAGGYKADGALGMVPWLQVNGKLSGGGAAGDRQNAKEQGSAPET